MLLIVLFIERQKKRSKYLVLVPNVRKTFLLSIRTPIGYSLASFSRKKIVYTKIKH